MHCCPLSDRYYSYILLRSNNNIIDLLVIFGYFNFVFKLSISISMEQLSELDSTESVDD